MDSFKLQERKNNENTLFRRNFFSVDSVYNAQNDRIWATNRVDASKRSGVKRKRKFPAKVMVWLGAC